MDLSGSYLDTDTLRSLTVTGAILTASAPPPEHFQEASRALGEGSS